MNKELIKNLMSKVWMVYPYASILAMESKGKTYSVSAQGIIAEQNPYFTSRGYVIKAHNGKRYVEYAFNTLDEESISTIVDKISKLFVKTEDMDVNTYPSVSEEKMTLDHKYSARFDPEEYTDEYIIDRLSQAREVGLKTDERILDCRTGLSYQKYTKYFLSEAKELTQTQMWTTGRLGMLVARDEEIKNYFTSYSSMEGIDVLDLIRADVKKVSAATLELLNSEKITPGTYECVCTPEVTGMIAHEAFGHGVEMDMFVKDRALAKDYIGKQVASDIVTMHDGAKAYNEVASYEFDDEGNLATDTVIIKNGILMRGINDMQTALALNDVCTGNGRRQNYAHKTYTRMTNTFFEGGNDSVEDMIASVSYGFLLDNPTCGMEDPKNWGIQCMVNVAREIKDGKLTGRIFSPIVLSGYVPDLLKSISMMSRTPVLNGSGMCGKGYKEWVKVSDGGPYIKARIRLG